MPGCLPAGSPLPARWLSYRATSFPVRSDVTMIDLYTFTTPNGWKASIALEEMALPYRTHVINIVKGDQFSRDFLAVNPNSKIPAIVDQDGPGGQPLAIFESGAILLYLAEKTGRFLPKDHAGRW